MMQFQLLRSTGRFQQESHFLLQRTYYCRAGLNNNRVLLFSIFASQQMHRIPKTMNLIFTGPLILGELLESSSLAPDNSVMRCFQLHSHLISNNWCYYVLYAISSCACMVEGTLSLVLKSDKIVSRAHADKT